MWTTEITSVVKNNVTFDVTVNFIKDGNLYETFTFRNVSDKRRLPRLIYDQLTQYKSVDALDTNTIVGPVDLTEFEPVVVDPPAKTQAEIDAENYSIKLALLRKMQLAIELGIIDNTQPTYVSTLNYIKTNFKPAYLDLL